MSRADLPPAGSALSLHIKQNKLPATKVNGRWRIQTDDLPLSEAELRKRARRAEELRETVDTALGPTGRLARRRYSVRDLGAFDAARKLWSPFVDTLGPAHPATVALRDALVAMGQGCHRFHEGDKRDAYVASREYLARAAVLALLTGDEAVAPLVDHLENEVLASLAGLIRRAERCTRKEVA